MAASGAGLALDLAHSVFDRQDQTFGDYLNMLAKQGGKIADPVLNPETLTGGTVHGVGKALETAYREGVSEPVVTAQTVAGGFAFEGKNPLDPDTWARAYEIAQNRSIGQGMTLQVFEAADALTGGGNNVNLLRGNEYDRLHRRVGKQSNAAQNLMTVHSGAADFAANFFLDPTIVAGKGAAVLKGAKTLRKITEADHAKGIGNLMETEDAKRVFGVSLGKGSGLKTRTESVIGTLNTPGFIDGKNAAQIKAGLPELERSTQGNQIASLLAETNKVLDPAQRIAARQRILRVAYGDQVAVGELKEELAHIDDQLANIQQGSVLSLEKAMVADSEPALFYVGEEAERPRYFDAPELVADAERQILNQRDAVRFLDHQRLEMKALLDVENAAKSATLRVSGQGKRALKRAEGDTFLRRFAREEAIETVWQHSLTAIPMRVVKKLYVKTPLDIADALKTSRLQGIVNLHDIDGTGRQMDSMMHRAQLTPKQRMELQSEYMGARTEADRMRIVAKIEQESVRAMAKRYTGQDLDTQKAVVSFVDELTRRGKMRRDSMAAALNGRAYAATKLKEGLDRTGKDYTEREMRIDQIDDDGVPVSLPILETQGANLVPLLDLDHAEKVLKREGSRLSRLAKAWQEERFQFDKLSRQKAAGGFILEDALNARRKMADTMVEVGEELTRIWKFGVLFRLGYPLRIIADDHMRIWAKIGAASMYHPMWDEARRKYGYDAVRRRRSVHARRMGLQGRIKTLDDLIGDEEHVKRFRETKAEIKSIDRKLAKLEGGSDVGFMDPKALKNVREPEAASAIRARRFEDEDQAEVMDELMTSLPKGFDPKRPITVAMTEDGQYGVIDGNHRLQAALELGLEQVPVKIMRDGSPQDYWGQADPEVVARALREGKTDPGSFGLPTRPSGEADRLRARRDALVQLQGDDVDELIRERDSLVALFDNKEAWQGELPEDAAAKAGVSPKAVHKRKMGEGKITIAGGYTLDDAFAGPYGDAARKMISSDETFEMNLLDSEARSYSSASAGSWKVIQPDEAGHLDAWEWAVNKQLRQSQVARQFIEGKSVDEVTRWLKSTQGRALRKRLPWHTADPEAYAHRVKAMVDEYVPEGSVREAARVRNVKKGDLEAAFGDDITARPAVHGGLVDTNVGVVGGVSGVINKAMSRMYRFISEAPTDALSRHPFFVAMYRQEARDLGRVKVAAAKREGRELTSEDLEEVTRIARERARHELKRTLFDMSAHSNAAHVMRFVSPFFSAHQEGLVRWYRLASDDPSVLRRFTQAFNMPREAGMVIDENGEPVKPGEPISGDHQIIVPKAVAKLMGFPEDEILTFNENSFNLVLQGGLTNPGFGPVAQIPVEWAAKKWADKKAISKLAKTMNPIRPDSVADIVLPATLRRVWAATQGEKSGEYAYYYSRTIADAVVQFQQDKGRMPTRREFARIEKMAKERTTAIAWLRVGQNFLSPAPATPQGRFAVQRDAWHRLMDEARQRGGKSEDYERAERIFLDKYGAAFFPLMESTSNNPAGMDATAQTVAAIKRHRGLLDLLPGKLHKMVVGPEAGGKYSGEAAAWLRQAQIKPGDPDTYYSSDDPSEAGLSGLVSKGWEEYNKAMHGLNAQAYAMGLASYRDSAVLTEMKGQIVDALARRNFAWWDDYNDYNPNEFETLIAGMQTIASNKRLLNDTARGDVHVLKQYLELRKGFKQMLAMRKQMGGSDSPEAESNAALMAQYSAAVSMLVESNTQFEAHMYNGILEHDPMLVDAPVAV